MIRLIIGRAGSGKTDLVLNEIKRKGEAGETGMILIVPEQFSHDTERELSRVCGAGASLYSEVLSFSRLSSRVLSETGGFGVKPLDPGGRLLLMSSALNMVGQELRSFRAVRSRADLLTGLIASWDEFSAAGITPGDLQELSETAQEQGLKDKLWDMGLIFEAYMAKMPKDMCDPSYRLEMMADRLENCSLFTNTVYFDGFTDFTYQQQLVIKKLMKIGRDLTFCLTLDTIFTRESVFRLTRETVALLHRFAKETGQTIDITVLEPTRPVRAQLRHLEANLLRTSPKPYNGPCDAIELYSAPNIWDECELAAAKTVELVRDMGLRWRDVGVTARAFEGYATILESVFDKYGVPVMNTAKSDILSRPVMTLIVSALETVTGSWEYENIFKYLKTELTGMDRPDRDVLENYVLQWDIRGQRSWTSEWGFHPQGFVSEFTDEDKELLERINQLREQTAEPLRILERDLRRGGGASEMAKALYRFLTAIDLPQTLSDRVSSLRQKGETQLAGEYLQLWDVIVEALEQFSGVLGDMELNVHEFRRLFTLLLSQYQVGAIPMSIDRVIMGDMSKMRRRVKCLIVLGADDDSLPRPDSGRGLIFDWEREELKQLGKPLNDDSDMTVHRENSLIYSALTLPSDKLIMCRSGLRPSPVVTEIENIFGIGEKPVETGIKSNSYNPCFELALGGNDEAEEYFRSDPVRSQRFENVLSAALAPRGKLSQSRAEELYSRDIVLSASRVDKFNSCKFMYFLEYGLRAKPRGQAKFDAPAAGTFMHYILENVARDAENAGGFGSISKEDCRELTRLYIQRYVDEILGGLENKSARFVYLFRRLCESVERVVADMAEELSVSDFKPLDFELSFAEGGDIDMVEITDGDVTVKVNGKVDRIDGWIHNGKLYLRVIDYKTGKKAFNLSDIWYGMGIQMLLYLFSLEAKGEKRYHEEIAPAGVLYAPAADVMVQASLGADRAEIDKERAKKLVRKGLLLNDPEVLEAMEHGGKSRFLPVKFNKAGLPVGDSLASADQFGSLVGHIDNVLLEMAREMRQGLVSADPYWRGPMDTTCMFCNFREACRFSEDAGDRRRYLKKMKPEEFWSKVMGGERNE